MTYSPKHTTAFSVNDILSPIEENYKKTSIEAAIPPLVSGYRGQQAVTGMNTAGMMNPYYQSQLGHGGYAGQYCNGAGELGHYGDPMSQVRSSTAGWYTANPDPRLASKCLINIPPNIHTNIRMNLIIPGWGKGGWIRMKVNWFLM